jgi:hypothetical protein
MLLSPVCPDLLCLEIPAQGSFPVQRIQPLVTRRDKHQRQSYIRSVDDPSIRSVFCIRLRGLRHICGWNLPNFES